MIIAVFIDSSPVHCAKSFAYIISFGFKAALRAEYCYLHLKLLIPQKVLSISAQDLQLSKRFRLKPESFSLFVFYTLFSLLLLSHFSRVRLYATPGPLV